MTDHPYTPSWPPEVEADAFRCAVALARAAEAGDGPTFGAVLAAAVSPEATVWALACLPGQLVRSASAALGRPFDVAASLDRLALVAASLDVLPTDDDG
ncbi:MAG: hypothetical protein M5U14_22205 [Acidimicrobiia bacterium]|nr:hypothetical protein [Acidimicrobiia bacterium]